MMGSESSASIAPIRILCANYINNEGSTPTQCQNPALKFCGPCLLVGYCGVACQKSHWAKHKLDCKSELRKDNWRPTWDKLGRQPAFLLPEDVKTPAYMRYLWGHTPAYNILKLEEHEGKAYDEDLALCFASSGDARNLIQPIIGLPKDYSGTVTCVVNEQDLLVVVRNVMTLIASMLLSPRKAAEFMLHLWYSARLTPDMTAVISHIKKLMENALEKFNNFGEDHLWRSTWNFGTRQLSLSLHKEAWPLMVRILSSEHVGPSFELGFQEPGLVTDARRRFVMLTPHLLDQRESHLFDLPPSQRLSAQRFREHGVLSPFGSDISAFTLANPTFYDIDTSQWLQHPTSNPLAGHTIEAVLRSGVQHGVPKNDIYGSFYTHVLSSLTAFSAKCADTKMNIDLYCVHPMNLPLTLSGLHNPFSSSAFDRIDTADLADGDANDLAATLSRFGPMLKSSKQNPHARLITLFPKAANESYAYNVEVPKEDAKKVTSFLPVPEKDPSGRFTAAHLQFLAAAQIVRDYDAPFDRYMEMVGFDKVGDAAGMEMLKTNTIVEAWPTRLKKRAGEEGAQRAFDLVLGSETIGCERYVEWVRKE